MVDKLGVTQADREVAADKLPFGQPHLRHKILAGLMDNHPGVVAATSKRATSQPTDGIPLPTETSLALSAGRMVLKGQGNGTYDEACEAIRLLSSALTATPTEDARSRVKVLEEALEWYAEQTSGCRKIGRDGDAFRQALDRDGGQRARTALGNKETGRHG